MSTTNRISSLFIGVLAITAMCATAAGDKIRDNFNDGVRDTSLWRLTENTIDIREKNGYLESRSKQSGGGVRWSGYESKNWHLYLNRSFTAKGTYQLGQAQGVRGDRYLSGGICLRLQNAPNADIDEIYVGVRYDASGYSVVFETFNRGTLVTFDSSPIQLQRTQLKLKYSAAKDRLDVRINGVRELRIRNFNSQHNLGDANGIVGFGAKRNGPVKWNYVDYRMDNFFLKGTLG